MCYAFDINSDLDKTNLWCWKKVWWCLLGGGKGLWLAGHAWSFGTTGNILFPDMVGGYMSAFTLRSVIRLFTFDLCTLLYVNNTQIKDWKSIRTNQQDRDFWMGDCKRRRNSTETQTWELCVCSCMCKCIGLNILGVGNNKCK